MSQSHSMRMQRLLQLAAVAVCLVLACASFASAASHVHTHRHTRAHSVGHSDDTPPSLQVWVTNIAASLRQASVPPPTVLPRSLRRASDSAPVLSVDPSQVYQRIVGFGGALTEASAASLAALPAAARAEVIAAYYGEQGNRYSTGRIVINSCDFSLSSFSYANVTDDFALKSFDRSLARDHQLVLPLVQDALRESYHPLQLFASPWSPPAWMKGNGVMDNSSTPGLRPEPQVHQAWADYIALWMTSMKDVGLPFWGLTVQNEPESVQRFESCVYSPEEERDFIRDYLGPTMRAAHPEVKLLAWDHNRDHVNIWADVIYADAEASQYIWGLGIHWYEGEQFDRVNATYHQYQAADKGLLATEATNGGHAPKIGDVYSGERYAHDIIGDLNVGVQGWTDWNIVLNTEGGPSHVSNWCDAPVIVNMTSQEVIYQPMYDYMGHFSRHLPPGSERIAHTFSSDWLLNNGTAGLEIATFLVQAETAEERLEREGDVYRQPGARSERKLHSAADPSPLGATIVLAVLNGQDTAATFELDLTPAGGAKKGHAQAERYYTVVHMEPHTIQTITYPVA